MASDNEKWFGWWKMVEFSFGFILAAAMGLAGWLYRKRHAANPKHDELPQQPLWPVWALVAFVILIFTGVDAVVARAPNPEASRVIAAILKDVLRILGSFVFFGAVCFALGLRPRSTAWQIAITLTFFHTVFDLVQDIAERNPARVSACQTGRASSSCSVRQLQWASPCRASATRRG